MKVILASPRGFCAGVDRAVEIVENAIERFGAPIYVHEIYGSGDPNNRILVNKVAEQVRSTIQSMVNRSREQRRSVFLG